MMFLIVIFMMFFIVIFMMFLTIKLFMTLLAFLAFFYFSIIRSITLFWANCRVVTLRIYTPLFAISFMGPVGGTTNLERRFGFLMEIFYDCS